MTDLVNSTKTNIHFFILLGLVFLVGASLRLHLLSGQILLDDEWHGINFVIANKTYMNILTNVNPIDNSSPLFNFYRLFLYRTIGWSEFMLRLPAILAGISSLLILPFLIRKQINNRAALIFALLLAISPFSIFYSRFSRAYSLAMLLCFWALILFYQWIISAKRGYAVGFIVIGGMAVYAHLFSIVGIFTPLAVTFGILIMHRTKMVKTVRPLMKVSLKQLSVLALIVSAITALLIAPALLANTRLPWTSGHLTTETLLTAATLISGTANVPLTIVFFILGGMGFIVFTKQKPLLGVIFAFAIAAYFLALLAARPNGIDTALVFVRYMIVAIPIALTMVAVAMDKISSMIQNRLTDKGPGRILPAIITLGFVGLLLPVGPLADIYTTPNNFSNHSAFQGTYQTVNWEQSDANHVYPAHSVRADQIPKFYHWLKTQPQYDTIIEYPFDICNYNNLLYYYQHFHQKRTIAGYCSDARLIGYERPKASDEGKFNVGIYCVDQSLVHTDCGRLAFRNMVDVTNIDAVIRCPADFVVLHKYIVAMKVMPKRTGTIPVYYQSVPALAVGFRKIWGHPVYEDNQIICFRIKKPGPEGPALGYPHPNALKIQRGMRYSEHTISQSGHITN